MPTSTPIHAMPAAACRPSQTVTPPPGASLPHHATSGTQGVTVVVPVYNVAAYIADCAASLFRQTYPDIEYIFCDDCTPDNSISILHDIAAQHPERRARVRVIRNTANMGLGATRLNLVRHIRTPFFIIADSDDILPPDAVATLMSVMEREEPDVVEGAYTEYCGGRHSAPILPLHGTAARYRRHVLCQNLIGNHVWGKLYRTSVLRQLPDAFIQGIDYAEDLCFTARLAAFARRSATDAVVYHYRTDNSTSYTKNISRRSMLSYIKASEVIYRFYEARADVTLPLEIGLLNVFRECRRNGIAHTEAEALLSYKPRRGITKILQRLLCGGSTAYRTGDFLYRVIRLFCSMA